MFFISVILPVLSSTLKYFAVRGSVWCYCCCWDVIEVLLLGVVGVLLGCCWGVVVVGVLLRCCC